MKTLTYGVLVLLMMSRVAVAEPVVRYDPATGKYLGCNPSEKPPVFLSDHNDITTVKPGFIYVNHNDGCRSVLPGVPNRYRKVVNEQVVEMTPAEKAVMNTPTPIQTQRQAIKASLRAKLIAGEGLSPDQADLLLERVR